MAVKKVTLSGRYDVFLRCLQICLFFEKEVNIENAFVTEAVGVILFTDVCRRLIKSPSLL
jgi:hypothetical protein